MAFVVGFGLDFVELGCIFEWDSSCYFVHRKEMDWVAFGLFVEVGYFVEE